jgi:hypothetical protein
MHRVTRKEHKILVGKHYLGYLSIGGIILKWIWEM